MDSKFKVTDEMIKMAKEAVDRGDGKRQMFRLSESEVITAAELLEKHSSKSDPKKKKKSVFK